MWPCETIETWKESYAIGEKSVNKNSASMNKWINHSTIIKAANNFCKNSYYTQVFFENSYRYVVVWMKKMPLGPWRIALDKTNGWTLWSSAAWRWAMRVSFFFQADYLHIFCTYNSAHTLLRKRNDAWAYAQASFLIHVHYVWFSWFWSHLKMSKNIPMWLHDYLKD